MVSFRKDQKNLKSIGNLKGDEEIATASSFKMGPDVEKKSFLDITTLIRSIQRAEGHADCFQKGIIDCDQVDCKWRPFCLEGHSVLKKDEA